MHFALIDTVLEATPDRLVALKNVTLAEEYLGDHFPGFPVLPGVFMVEAMVQAARKLLESRGCPSWVLGEVKAMRYGSLVRPGESLRVEVTLDGEPGETAAGFRGSATVIRQGAAAETAVSGRFTMRPLRRE
ncbi:MAG: polyketide synthase dehydratase domain-containing protein [Phycisphaeraceae bacterium]|nr:polyketide synthase dehydratase domain-containing protein [Phycisphaeraceae bacterium]